MVQLAIDLLYTYATYVCIQQYNYYPVEQDATL